DRNRSHWSTSKTPSYTKSVSWQHHPILFKLREDAPPLNLTEDITPPFSTKANYLIHPVR
ncbi:hypothetical protein OU595_23665, partial [Escherichia coli]|nr:hypothetical protein [Escherichia coli]